MPAPTATGPFERLHPALRRWTYDQGWSGLHDIQERAIEPVLAGRDVLIAGPTAGGKTEAAFLPVLSRLPAGEAASVQVLYVSPLKALINDQERRLEGLCERVGVAVTPWHGDVGGARKARLLDDPSGVLLITPESLEAVLVGRGTRVAGVFADLAAVVWDELHAFLGTVRGHQLQSILHRVELATGRRVPRIGLSATLGDLRLAAGFLRPAGADDVAVVAADGGGQELRVVLRGVRESTPDGPDEGADGEPDAGGQDVPTSGEELIADALYRTLRGTDNLAFANSRREVELYAELLARRCVRDRVPIEFLPHHGSLSRDSREDVERRLRDRTRPVTAVCTSTLELGIDIGSVTSIAQVGAPPSVATLRQRLGRSGRRGEPAVLRLYVREPALTSRTAPQDALRTELVQTTATLLLLAQRWYEPPPVGMTDGSTLVQQLLSLIAERGGILPRSAYRALCASGPFSAVTPEAFAALLRRLGELDLIVQSSDGALLHGGRGERIVNHYSFYAAFATPEEYQLVAGGRTLGTIPVDAPLAEGALLVFSGRRWRILSVDEGRRRIELSPAGGGGAPPVFGGGGAPVHGRVRAEMRRLLETAEVPPFLDAEAARMLGEARESYARLELDRRRIVEHDGGATLFPWAGDAVTNTLVVQLLARGVTVASDRFTLTAPRLDASGLRRHLRFLAVEGPADALMLARGVRNRGREKYDWALPPALLDADYAARQLDPHGAWEVAKAA